MSSRPIEKQEFPIKEKPTSETREEKSSYELTQTLRSVYLELKNRHGKTAADLMLSRIVENPDDSRTLSGVDRFSAVEKVRNAALAELEKMSILRLSPEGITICDLNRLKTDLKSTDAKKRLGPIYTAKHLGDQKFSKTLTLIFEGTKVVSEEDYENGVREQKDLFYLPENAEDALDVKKIKESKFYLTLYDVAKPGSYQPTDNYNETKYGNIDSLGYREVLIPVLIYHPQYGNGYRDSSTGDLFVYDIGSDKPKNISVNYFKRNFGGAFGNAGVSEESFDTPRSFVKKHLSHLAEKGLLLPEDFGISTDTSTSRLYRISKKPGAKGVVMFNGVKHNLGSEFSRNNIRIYQISTELGGIVEETDDGKKNLIATFTIFQRDETLKSPGGYYTAGVEKTNVAPFNSTDFYQKKEGEGDEAFQKRIKLAENFSSLLELSDCLAREANLNLGELDFREQQQIVAAARKYDFKNNPRFLKFAKEYDQEGLKALAAIEQNENLGEKIFQIGENIDPKAAYQIFRKYNQLMATAKNIEIELVDLLRDEEKVSRIDIRSVREKIAKRANHLLVSFAEKALGKDKFFGVESAMRELDNFEKDALVTAVAYREYKRLGGNYQELAGTEYQQATAREISRNKKAWEQMSQMYWGNWAHKPALRKLLVEGFNQKIKSGGDDTMLHILRQGNNIRAFCRTDRIGPEKIYFASLNVSLAVQGSALGWALRESILELYMRDNDIIAECDPSDPKSTSEYIERDGFAVTEVFFNYEGTGEFIFKIIRDRNGPEYALHKLTRENFAKKCSASLDEKTINQPVMLKFKSGSSEMQETVANLVNNKGYQITRYFFSPDGKVVFCGFERPSSGSETLDEAAA